MAYLKPAKTEDDVRKMTLGVLKKEYNSLAETHNKLLNREVIYCPDCGEWISASNFYTSDKYKTGFYPICKKCVLMRVEQRKKKTDTPNETKQSVQDMLHDMDLPYIDSFYESCCKAVRDDIGEKVKASPFTQYYSSLRSLSQYRGKKWKDSEFPIEVEELSMSGKVKQATIKRFGNGLTNDEYLFLQTQYEDWISRYECKTKAQEELFERLSWKKLEIFKATRDGKPTDKLDESYQKIMSTANITPRQNSTDVLSEGQTLGQLIERWETERPIPEIDEELKDVDKIGLYIDVFFKGHMAKLLNLKNPLQHIYESFIKKYTVEKPEYDEESDSEELFTKIFGKTDG